MREPVRVEVDAELLPLVPGFLENRRRDLELIAAALESGDLEPVVRLGHNMKGAGSAYGFDRISELGADLEAASRVADEPQVRRLHAELADYLARLEVAPG